jgi:hypothetical protein
VSAKSVDLFGRSRPLGVPAPREAETDKADLFAIMAKMLM